MALLHALDISTYQNGLNLGHAVEELDLRAIYVKVGGDNVGRYIAPHYAEEVDRARRVVPYVGHYWVPGKTDPVGAADYYVQHLRHFDRATDFVVLDNESLDSGHFYGDTDADRWVARVMDKLGIPAAQVIVYFPAGPVLRAMRWPRLERRGIAPLVASYGANTGRRDHEPIMAGRFGDRWAAHQYTSNGRVSGWDGALDLNVFQSSFFGWAKEKPKGASAAPSVSTPSTKAPTGAQAKELQAWAKLGGYDGPIDGKPGEQTWTAVQRLLKEYGYTGATDGDPGELTYQALQRFAAKHGGYDGPIDGEPGPKTWQGLAKAAAGTVDAAAKKPTTSAERDAATKAEAAQKAAADRLVKEKAAKEAAAKVEREKAAKEAAARAKAEKEAAAHDTLAHAKAHAAKALQTWARRGGYHGPVDGKLGVHSWSAVQTLLARSYGYAGAIDGHPGPLTLQALQRLAKKGGYTGPIDGELGIRSWTGVATALGA